MHSSEQTGRDLVNNGWAVLGIELGSTTVKATLVDGKGRPLASGRHVWENEYVDGIWTYSLDAVHEGLRRCHDSLVADVQRRYEVRPSSYAAIGVSAMMHGYLVLDGDNSLLTPFRTWRNTTTGPAASRLSELLGVNIPLRWSVAHLYQAMLDGEEHVPRIRSMTTLAGYVHRRLTGRHVLGVGDASGMFPIDPATGRYDEGMLDAFDALAKEAPVALERHLGDLLPTVVSAGADAGTLTAEGAVLLDPTGGLAPGIVLCPPEGDAGTGMVATDAIAPGRANVSVGTSVFAMVVLDGPMNQAHEVVDVVTTPVGDPVAMVHCNNGAGELQAWAGVFGDFAVRVGLEAGADDVFSALLEAALDGDADAGGLVAYNYLAGEPVTGVDHGHPLVVRSADSSLVLGNVVRALLYSVFATLTLGLRVLQAQGVRIDLMLAHGGLFRTEGVAQRMLAAATGVPVALAPSSSEGGSWGMAVLAAYRVHSHRRSLQEFLSEVVFADVTTTVLEPHAADVAGYAVFLERYAAGLTAQHALASLDRSPPH